MKKDDSPVIVTLPANKVKQAQKDGVVFIRFQSAIVAIAYLLPEPIRAGRGDVMEAMARRLLEKMGGNGGVDLEA